MKKQILTIILSIFLLTSLIKVPANAYNKGWNVYSDGLPTTWFYIFDDGSMAYGWQFIDGEWYYFEQKGDYGVTLVGGAYISRFGNWKHFWDSGFYIDNRLYYFDEGGRLIRNTTANISGADVYIDENGHTHY